LPAFLNAIPLVKVSWDCQRNNCKCFPDASKYYYLLFPFLFL